jgi:hypothetical protein
MLDACRRRNITARVEVWRRHDQNVCVRHQRWIGEGSTSREQPDLSTVPKIVKSQWLHRRLILRYGIPVTFEAISRSQVIINKWNDKGHYTESRNQRLTRMLGEGWNVLIRGPYYNAAHYSEVVALASVLVSPYWQWMAVRAEPVPDPLFLRGDKQAAEARL